MVDPINFTNYKRNNNELQETVLFSLLVSGKNALTTARLLEKFLEDHVQIGNTPFDKFKIYPLAVLPGVLKKYGFGCYNSKAKGIYQLVNSGINLRDCTFNELRLIHGIGPKTANLFLMHTRESYRGACIDTHILKYLRDLGYKVPKSTPSKKKYAELQEVFLEICDKRNVNPAKLDLEIWNYYRKLE